MGGWAGVNTGVAGTVDVCCGPTGTEIFGVGTGWSSLEGVREAARGSTLMGRGAVGAVLMSSEKGVVAQPKCR